MQLTWCAYCNDVRKNQVECARPYDSIDFRSGFTVAKLAGQWLPYSHGFLLFQTETKLVRHSADVNFQLQYKNLLLDPAVSKHLIKIMPRCVPYFLPSYYLNGDLRAKETQVYRNSINPSSPKIDILAFYFFYWNKKCSSLLIPLMSWGVEDIQVPRRCNPEMAGIV